MALKKFVAPGSIMGSSIQSRPVATQPVSQPDSLQILASQRKLRPTSPHLMIYKIQITSVLSILTRITGASISGGFYIFGSLYLLSPLLGLHMDSVSMAAAFGALPGVVKVAAKAIVALPFTFHSINGIRHLVWDFGLGFKNKEVIKTGWTVVGLTAASTLALVAFL